jgi:hypothetical protein
MHRTTFFRFERSDTSAVDGILRLRKQAVVIGLSLGNGLRRFPEVNRKIGRWRVALKFGTRSNNLLSRLPVYMDFSCHRPAPALSAIAIATQIPDVTAVKALPLTPTLAVALIEKVSFRRAGPSRDDGLPTGSRLEALIVHPLLHVHY